MNKKILIPIIVVGLIVVLLFGSYFMWLVKGKKSMNIYILNKTVPTLERIEHKSFHWILNHHKYTKLNGDRYDLNNDYYGFFPLNTKSQEFDFKSIRIHEIEDIANELDMLYYADTYGVYYNEWYKKDSKEVNHTQKVYGGLNQNDYLLLKEMKKNNKLIITEFNLYNAPTNGLIREKVENLFGLDWTGWTGKCFSRLDTLEGSTFPDWIVKLYQEQNNNEWPFTKGGIVLVHKFGTIAVLEMDTHLTQEIPVIIANQDAIERFDIPQEVYYSQWFDMTFSEEQNDVLANFKINVTAQGDSILRSYNLKSIFPAVIEHIGDYRFYYFGGDFADNKMSSNTAFFEGFHNIASKFNGNYCKNSTKFFWTFYVPMMSTIMDDYYNTLER